MCYRDTTSSDARLGSRSRLIVLAGGLFATLLQPFTVWSQNYDSIQPFLDQYCVKCHGDFTREAEVRLDDFRQIRGRQWSEVYEVVLSGEMPPEDEPQPPRKLRRQMEQLIDKLSRDSQFSISTGFRRLNRREYANTVRDLLGLEVELFDPAEKIFADEVDAGFDTNGETLVLSNELLLEYTSTAKANLRMALFLDDLKKPVTRVVEYRVGKLRGGDNRFTTYKKKSTVTREGNNSIVGEANRRAVSVPGRYRVKVIAAGVDRDNYPVKFAPVDGPIKMGIGVMLDGQRNTRPAREIRHRFDLKDEVFETFEVEMHLEKGAYPFVTFLNGASKAAAAIRAAGRRAGFRLDGKGMRGYAGPGVEIKHFSIEGPLTPQWPPASYVATFQSDRIPDFSDPAVRKKLLHSFLHRAYRRPVTSEELRDYQDFLEANFKSNGSRDWQAAIIDTFAAIMSSPGFLYIHEQGTGALGSYELANRLSYFFWSSMPDAELFELAKSGKIQRGDVLLRQIERMLDDPKSEALLDGFAMQWLSLDELGTMPPDIKNRQYRIYHRQNLEEAFRTETLTYFRHVLFENQPLADFLDSSYTFVNANLANLYGLRYPANATGFTRVSIPANSPRGGLLGQGSIHALTSNGVETLPVTRGHWVLDELLGDPPPPPPKEVPALVPDLNGLSTPRDQLARHREDEACASCHRQMDPIGLAMESFDMIGRFRTSYSKKSKIDPSGEIDGQKFANVRELKTLLRRREEAFARSMVEKLAEYAKGRELNRNDMELVEAIVRKAASNRFRFKDTLLAVASSKLMRDR